MTPVPDKWDDYCFDLEGFLILEERRAARN